MLLIFVDILKTYYRYFKLKLHDCMCIIALVLHKHARVTAPHMLLSEQQCWCDYVRIIGLVYMPAGIVLALCLLLQTVYYAQNYSDIKFTSYVHTFILELSYIGLRGKFSN